MAIKITVNELQKILKAEWLLWAAQNKLDFRMIDFISENPEMLDGAEFKNEEQGLEKTPDRRGWERVSKILQKTKQKKSQKIFPRILIIAKRKVLTQASNITINDVYEISRMAKKFLKGLDYNLPKNLSFEEYYSLVYEILSHGKPNTNCNSSIVPSNLPGKNDDDEDDEKSDEKDFDETQNQNDDGRNPKNQNSEQNCHAELDSTSLNKKIPRQVRNDNENPQIQNDEIFDSELKSENPLPMKKASQTVKIIGRGGTNFQVAVNFYLSHSEYDGLIYFTDGFAPLPEFKTKRRIDVLWGLQSKREYENFKNQIKSLRQNRATYIPNPELKNEKQEKIRQTAKNTIRVLIPNFMAQTGYEWNLVEEDEQAILQVKMKRAKMIEITLGYKSFTDKIPELMNVIKQMDELISTIPYPANIKSYGRNIPWKKNGK